MQFGHLPWVLAERYGDRPAVADEFRALTFEQLDRRAEAFAGQLRQLGVGRGDVLGIMLHNRVELLVAILAAWRLGAAATPVNPGFTSSEAQHQLDDSGALVVLHEGQLELDGPLALHVADMAVVVREPLITAEPAEEDLALLIYTSGSTGRPKGVMLSHGNVEAMSSTIASHFELTADDHCLLVLPLFHVNALMVSALGPLRVGGRVTVLRSFSAQRFLREVERLRPTYFSAVPTIYALLVSQTTDEVPDTTSLRFVVCGAAPVSRELLEACEQRLGLTIVEGYGLTESTCASACNPVNGVRKLGTVGPALPGQRIAIAGPDGAHLPLGQAGEVLIAGPTVMRGYLGDAEATRTAIVDGWLRTGDVGVLDEDGYLRIVDRIKDLIIRGGENIYPKELESTLAQVDGVLDVAVVGRPDAVLGEVPVAFVSLYPEAHVTEDQLLMHCREHLARVKVPVSVTLVDALPRNPVGKIDKPALRRSLVPV